ncbi:MAG: tyrosine-type recombinase/integrase, partial [Planctomycetota bacterium]
MNKRVWTFQYKKDVEAKGPGKASWYVGYYDLDGGRHSESCGPGSRGKRESERRAKRLEAELITGTHEASGKVKWARFREEYEAKILPRLAPRSREQIKAALDHFQRIAKPGRMENIKTQAIDAFVTTRRTERGKKPGSTISPATVNKDLRHVKAALRIANEWGYLPKVPKVRMVREPEKLPQYVTPEHFGTLYHEACPLAKLPQNPEQHYQAAEWWRALVVFAYMTGWRIEAILGLRREDLDLEAGTAISRHEDTKGRRDVAVPLHPAVVDHLRKIVGFHPFVFRWCHERTKLWLEFGRLQREAGIKLPCREQHDHTPACYTYGFHDLRRAFATVNAPRMKPEALQRLMQHKSYQTTLRYIGLADQLTDAVESMPVPEALR